jgi:hypothetical protein
MASMNPNPSLDTTAVVMGTARICPHGVQSMSTYLHMETMNGWMAGVMLAYLRLHVQVAYKED